MNNIRVKVPGSIMLMGEHSVLFGEKALACAVDKYITLSLIPCSQRTVDIKSALAEYHSDLDSLTAHPCLSFVLAAIEQFSQQLPGGFELRIESEFSHTVGLGSSAAVTAGVVAVLAAYAGLDLDNDALFEESLRVVHKVQGGRGSGTDLVASIYGSIVSYSISPRSIRALSGLPEISLYYVGYKTTTPVVLKKVEQLRQSNEAIYDQIYALMGQVTSEAESAVLAKDWPRLGCLMNNYQGLMDALGVSDLAISDLVYHLRGSDSISGAKISGSGLGDCVIALGVDTALNLPYEQIPVGVSEQGVNLEYF